MRVLLDTHVLLWTLADDHRLSKEARKIIEAATEIYVSTASYWEVAIKSGLGKLPVSLIEIRLAAQRSGFNELPISGEHTEALLTLADHHRDPFDRMLVAQAISEPMRLLTADAHVARYTELATLI